MDSYQRALKELKEAIEKHSRKDAKCHYTAKPHFPKVYRLVKPDGRKWIG